MACDLGTGTTITFGTSSFAFELLEVNESGESREAIDCTHMGTSATRAFVPGDLTDGGSITVRGHYTGAQDPPIDAAAETITIDWGGSGLTCAFSGFMTNFAAGAQIEEKMEFTAEIKVAGAITRTTS
jgi:hypothetical protein